MLRSRACLVLLVAVAFPSIAACSATPTPLPIDPPGPEPRDDASAPIDASVPNEASAPNDGSTPQAQTPPGDPPLSFVATFAGAPAVITNVSVHPHPTVRDRIYIIAEMTPGSIPTAGPLQTGIRLDIGTKQAIGTTDCLVSLPFVSFFFYDDTLGVQRNANPDSLCTATITRQASGPFTEGSASGLLSDTGTAGSFPFTIRWAQKTPP